MHCVSWIIQIFSYNNKHSLDKKCLTAQILEILVMKMMELV